MADQRVNIKVTTQGAGKSKKDLGGLNKSITSLGRSVLNASAAYFGATGLIRGLMKSAELAGIQEQAEKRLEVALGKTSNALLKQASSLQKMTVFGDESIIGVQASIAAFVDSEDQIKKATEATLDMAVAMGMDLKGAGDLIAKTLGSSTNALSRYGIEVTGAVGSTERLESLTSNVAKLFGGQAKAQAETYAGSVEQLKNELGDMAENIGTIVIPIFEKLSPHLKTAISFWQNYLDVGKKTSEQTSSYDEQIKSLNDQIAYQSDLIKDLGTTNAELNVEGEKNQLLRKRAFDQGRLLEDQIIVERENISELTKQVAELREKKQQEIRLKELEVAVGERNLEIRKQEIDLLGDVTKVTAVYQDFTKKLNTEKEKSIILDLKSAALSGQSAMEAMKSVVRAETMEAVAGYISGVLKGTPYPLNLILAAGGGGLVAGLMDKALSSVSAETGFEGVVTKPTMFLTGENNKPEQVSVTPLGGGSASGITINISAPLLDDTVVESIIPAIERARKLGIA